VSDQSTPSTRWGEGYKSGGNNNPGSRATNDTRINPLNPGPPVAVTDVNEKETNDSFEIGFKARLAGNRVSVEGSMFDTNANDLQFFEFIVGPFGLLRFVENIDEAEMDGFELAIFSYR
jgi:Outer membrane receptor proteins, mostly Fe transport